MRRFGMTRFRLWWERAFWVVPVVGVLIGIVVQESISELDEELASLSIAVPQVFSTSSALALLGAIGGGMITFTGFVFSFVVLILQFGSSQYSPRTVSYFLRARSTRIILAIFLATITVTFLSMLDVGSLGRSDFAPSLALTTSVALLFVSLGAFIALLHSVGSRVRVDAVLSAMGRQARRQLPKQLWVSPRVEAVETVIGFPDCDQCSVLRSNVAGQTVAIDAQHLLRVAARHDLRVELQIQVGDSVTIGSPLMRVSAAGAPLSLAVGRALARAVVVDKERSLRYDPFYSLRLLVDVGVRALSPGINDPTTAVRALDEIEGVLRVAAELPLGVRRLRAGKAEVVVRAPGWPDIVALGLLEIMVCGSGQPQVTRRLVALIDDLVADLPEAGHAPLLDLRADLVARVRSEDYSPRLAAIAQRGDRQGLGGTLGAVRA
jgi:uncharacterized membrane protein